MLVYVKRLWDNQFIQAICFALVLWLAYLLRDVLAVLFLGFVVMSGFLPLVEYFFARSVPKFLAILIPYILLVFVIALAGYIIIPVIIIQTEQLVLILPQLVVTLTQHLSSNALFSGAAQSSFSSLLNYLSDWIVSLPGMIFSISISVFTIIVISLYLLWDKMSRDRPYMWIIPDSVSPEVIKNVERAMGGWLRGQLILSASVALIVWLGLFILRIQFSAPLGVMAGILEVVPYVGPIISAVIAILIALSISWQKALFVAILFFIIQQIEGNILVPQIMKHNLELHPITIIVSILIGTELMGVLGAIVAVPVATAVAVILSAQGYGVRRQEKRRLS